MKSKNLKEELMAEIRNKLTLPRTVLEAVLAKDKNIKTVHLKKSIKSIDEIPVLIEKRLKVTRCKI